MSSSSSRVRDLCRQHIVQRIIVGGLCGGTFLGIMRAAAANLKVVPIPPPSVEASRDWISGTIAHSSFPDGAQDDVIYL